MLEKNVIFVSMINVTYAITVCNELVEITNLINFLHPRIKKGDEILIQYDSDAVTSQVKDYLTILTQLHSNVRVIAFPLNKDFASYKNNLKNHANGMLTYPKMEMESGREWLDKFPRLSNSYLS